MLHELLFTWIECIGDDVLKDILDDKYEDIVRVVGSKFLEPDEEKQIINMFQMIVRRLQMYEKKPVIFLIDQCNAFHTNPHKIKLCSDDEQKVVSPHENPVASLFLEWNAFKVCQGGVFHAFSSACQLMTTAKDGNEALFSRVEPMNHVYFQAFYDLLCLHRRLRQMCSCDDLFVLCGGIPREACQFVLLNKRSFDDIDSNYQKLKENYITERTRIYRERIQCLLKKNKNGPGRS